MKYVVTGATGFLGGWTVRRMAQAGHEAIALGRNLEKGKELAAQGAVFRPVSLNDVEALKAVFNKADAVVHCAGLSSPWGRKSEFYSSNVTATKNVLEAARAAGVGRVVHISSPSLYVTNVDRENVVESDPIPDFYVNDYSWSKKLAEDEVDQAVAAGFPVVSLRPQAIVGPGDQAIFPRVLRLARKGFLPVIGDGLNRIDMTCVENVVDAVELAISAPAQAIGKKYNITNGEPVSLYRTFDKVLGMLGYPVKKIYLPFGPTYALAGALEKTFRVGTFLGEPPLTRYTVCVLGRTRTLSIEAARRDLGYKPRLSLDEGIERFVKHLKETGA